MNGFFIYKFTRKQRYLLAVAFIATNIMQVVLGAVITGWSIYVCLSVTKYLYSERAEIVFVFTVIGMYGTHIIIQYLVGIKICEKCFLKAHKRSTKRHLYFWLATCMNTIINILVLATLTANISKHIVRSIRHSMEKGLRNYLKDPVWKHTIDRWQFTLRCCGVTDFTDWYSISWLDKYHIDVNSDLVQKFLLSKDHLHLPVVPWSCCDYQFPLQCFHDPLQQIEFAHLWKEQPDFLDGAISKKGCLDVITKPIQHSLIGFILIASLLIVNQFLIIIISRFLYTSCRNAVVLRNTAGISPGWLFGRDCLYPIKGRTISEVMFDLEGKEDKKSVDRHQSADLSVKPSPRESEHNAISSEEEDALMLRRPTKQL